MLWPAVAKDDPAASTWEPAELTSLKRKLATLSCHFCNCITARKAAAIATSSNAPNEDKIVAPKAVSFQINPNDKDVQVGHSIIICSFDRCTQACEGDIIKDQPSTFQPKKDMCPSCFVTMNLLQAGKLFRVLKDEESETTTQTCDQCTEKLVESVEKTTSFTTSPYDNYELCRVVTYSDTSLSQDVKRSPHVKFWDVTMSTDINSMFSPPCVCMDELIDSIRPTPPLSSMP